MAYGMADPISKPAWRYTIGSTPNFGSFQAAKMTPFWDPNFPLPCCQLAAPFLYAQKEPGPKFKLYTHGTLRVTRTGEQAGKALRSQGHHYARVM